MSVRATLTTRVVEATRARPDADVFVWDRNVPGFASDMSLRYPYRSSVTSHGLQRSADAQWSFALVERHNGGGCYSLTRLRRVEPSS